MFSMLPALSIMQYVVLPTHTDLPDPQFIWCCALSLRTAWHVTDVKASLLECTAWLPGAAPVSSNG